MRPSKWTSDDEIKLIEFVSERRLVDPEPSLLALIKNAQLLLLPPDRQKFINNSKAVSNIIEGVKAKLSPINVLSNSVPINDVPINNQPKVDIDSNLIEMYDELKRFAPKQDLIRLETILNDNLVGIYERLDEVEATLKARRLRLAIAGLKGNQYNILKSAVDKYARLTYIEVLQAKPSIPTDADYILMAKNFISHRFSISVEELYKREQIITIDGVSDKFEEIILDLYKEHNR